jgi:aminopeptidase N
MTQTTNVLASDLRDKDQVVPTQPTPGAPGLGDSLYPNFGNGGYDVKRYNINLNVSDVSTSALTGLVNIRATATQSLSSFNLDFIGFEIASITVNGKAATFTRDGQELTITPAEPLLVGERFRVRVKYKGSPEPITSVAIPVPTGWVNFGDGSFVLSEPDGAANYYPVNDHPLDKATYKFRVTVPNPFEVAANGILKNAIARGNKTTYIWQARDPMASYLTTVNISDFNVTTSTSPDGIPIRNYFAVGIPDALLEPFDLQPEMLSFFSDIFGPYPFEVYGAVVMNTETGTALEPQTMSIFGIDQLGRASTEETIAHEVAHQWLGNSVSLVDWSDIWLNESFATYAQGLWIEYTRGAAALDEWIAGEYDFVATFLDQLVPPGEPPADDLFNPGVYDWGALGLHALRLEIGDEDFFELLKTYYNRFKGGNVTHDDLIAVAEEVSAEELDPFFERWFYSETLPAIPELGLFNDSLIGETSIDLSDFTGQTVTLSVGVTETTTGLNNKGGFYVVDNPEGIVVDPLTGIRLAPGDPGYAKAALQQSVQLLDSGDLTVDLPGGAYYVPYLLANGNLRNFYTPFAGSNRDGLDHVEFSAGVYGFEDRLGLGDRDFNDFAVQVTITSIL